jgi:hypothetical protein
MLDNLGLKKGDRVLIVSELLDEMGWYGKLERRTRFGTADADTYVYDIARRVRSARTRSQLAGVFERGWTTFRGTKIPYPMADWWHGYPYLQRYVPKAKIPGR